MCFSRKKTEPGKNTAFLPKRRVEGINAVYFGENRFIRVVDQPSGRPEFVSSISGVATNFQLAARYGNIGLIAHNYLAGRHFSELNIGDPVYVMDGHGHKKPYQVREMLQYQALDPHNVRSNFRDLETEKIFTVSDVFRKIYMGQHHLILQTCIKKGNNDEWGRCFILAYPLRQ